MGKPRHGHACDMMNRSRLNFKYALRQCQANEEVVRADAMARAISGKDTVSFWKSVNKTKSQSVPLASNVNGANGQTDIADMWSAHYSLVSS